jgi:hypothetical protein
VLPLEEIALSADGDPHVLLREQMQRQGVGLRQAPMMKLRVAFQKGRCYALLQTHHFVMDNVSQNLLLDEVIAHLEGRAQRLPESMPYRNHVAQSLGYARRHEAEGYFRQKLGDVKEPTAPYGLLDVHADGSQVCEAYELMEAGLAQRVRQQGRRLGVSAATLFHAAWALVVGRTSGRQDVVYGTVLLGRLQGSAGAQRTLGMFINTLPLRLQLQGMTAKGLVEQTQRELVQLLTHEHASLAEAQRCSGVGGSLPLFSALLNYRHSAADEEVQTKLPEWLQILATQARTNYPMMVSVDDLGEGFGLTVQTDPRIPAQRVNGYLRRAVQSLVEALEREPQRLANAGS